MPFLHVPKMILRYYDTEWKVIFSFTKEYIFVFQDKLVTSQKVHNISHGERYCIVLYCKAGCNAGFLFYQLVRLKGIAVPNLLQACSQGCIPESQSVPNSPPSPKQQVGPPNPWPQSSESKPPACKNTLARDPPEAGYQGLSNTCWMKL